MRRSSVTDPSFIYFDGEWEFPLDSFEMQDFLAWLYNDSPCKDDVVVNDRFGKGSRGKHGGVYCSEAGVRESGTDHKWCEDRPISRGNWSYNRLERLEDYLSERDLIHLLVETVALGGNLHLDVSALCGRHDSDAPAGAAGADGRLAEGQWRGDLRDETMDRAHEGPMVESVNPRLDKDWKWTETKQRPMVHYTRKVMRFTPSVWRGRKDIEARIPTHNPANRDANAGPRPAVDMEAR